MQVIAISTCDLMDPLETRYKLIRAKLAGVKREMLGLAIKVLTETREMYIEHFREGLSHTSMIIVLTESIEVAENCIRESEDWNGKLVFCGVPASSAKELSIKAGGISLYVTAAGNTLQEIMEQVKVIQAAGISPAVASKDQCPLKAASLIREAAARGLGLRVSFPAAHVKDTASEYDMAKQAALAMFYLRHGADVVVIEANFKWAIQPIAKLIAGSWCLGGKP